MFLSHYTTSFFQSLYQADGPCTYLSNEDSWCGARFNSIIDDEFVWMSSDVWDQPRGSIDMREVYFEYDRATDEAFRGKKALLHWAEIVGCTNVGDWVFAADWQAAGYPPTPCSGDVYGAWNGSIPQIGS